MRLSRITNPHQRAALRKAIADGEAIPDYAWIPLPAALDRSELLRLAREAAESDGVPVAQHANAEAPRPSADDVHGEIVRHAAMLRPTATAASDSTGPAAADLGPDVIDHVFSSMKIDTEWSVREPRGFTWWGHRLA